MFNLPCFLLSFINRLYGRADGEVSRGQRQKREGHGVGRGAEGVWQQSKCGGGDCGNGGGNVSMVSLVIIIVDLIPFRIMSFVNSSIEEIGGGVKGGYEAAAKEAVA